VFAADFDRQKLVQRPGDHGEAGRLLGELNLTSKAGQPLVSLNLTSTAGSGTSRQAAQRLPANPRASCGRKRSAVRPSANASMKHGRKQGKHSGP